MQTLRGANSRALSSVQTPTLTIQFNFSSVTVKVSQYDNMSSVVAPLPVGIPNLTSLAQPPRF
jgi:hypothetical protein